MLDLSTQLKYNLTKLRKRGENKWKKDREIVINVKKTLMLLNEHDKDRVLAFSEGMMLMAKNNKEASWWQA